MISLVARNEEICSRSWLQFHLGSRSALVSRWPFANLGRRAQQVSMRLKVWTRFSFWGFGLPDCFFFSKHCNEVLVLAVKHRCEALTPSFPSSVIPEQRPLAINNPTGLIHGGQVWRRLGSQAFDDGRNGWRGLKVEKLATIAIGCALRICRVLENVVWNT